MQTIQEKESSSTLILKSISELLGVNFFIPHYQRGYRWTEQQVKDLLSDINSFTPQNISGSDEKTFYCLQPIVVKECDEEVKKINKLSGTWYEVIDGQQRLTTIFLITQYANEMWVGKQKNSKLNIRYETRSKSADFLQNLQVDDPTNQVKIDKSNIDFYHISKGYETIHNWVISYKQINDKDFDNNDFQSKLKSFTKIIWYEVNEESDSIELFTRLNMGKIPLTNAELIKALFLSSSSFQGQDSDNIVRMKMEIAQIWDEIELKLNDEDFWSFVTNKKKKEYATKIELLLDMKAGKKKRDIDPLFTFLYFLGESKDSTQSLWDLWVSIEKYFMTLCEWYKDKNLYHKVGYLITVGEAMESLIETSMIETKKDFQDTLIKKIGGHVDSEIADLTYESDYEKIEKLLLLFNVESIRANKNATEFYPFKFHKGTNWSLEHIHAQNSDSLDKNKREQWVTWLQYHKILIEELLDNETTDNVQLQKIIEEINLVNNEKLTWQGFYSLSETIIKAFSETDPNPDNMHSISNLALLSQPDNSALNNSVFEVKRREIINMDKQGSYIPLCTKRVFLKYYNDKPSTQQYYFWGKKDRDHYMHEIKSVLKKYLVHEGEIKE